MNIKNVYLALLCSSIMGASAARAVEIKGSEEIPSGSLLIWNGESDSKDMNKFRHGELNTTEAFKGNGCFAAERDKNKYPELYVPLTNINGYDEIWFHVKASKDNETCHLKLISFPNRGNEVKIDHYINGNKITKNYKLVKIPIKDLSEGTKYDGTSIRIIAFGGVKPWPPEAHMLYIDEIYAVRTLK